MGYGGEGGGVKTFENRIFHRSMSTLLSPIVVLGSNIF